MSGSRVFNSEFNFRVFSKMKLLILLLLSVSSSLCVKIYEDFLEVEVSDRSDEVVDSEPLFLTPLIENGEIEKAQLLSKVTALNTTLESYSGYITVNKPEGGHMFFWYFPSQVRHDKGINISMWYGESTETVLSHVT